MHTHKQTRDHKTRHEITKRDKRSQKKNTTCPLHQSQKDQSVLNDARVCQKTGHTKQKTKIDTADPGKDAKKEQVCAAMGMEVTARLTPRCNSVSHTIQNLSLQSRHDITANARHSFPHRADPAGPVALVALEASAGPVALVALEACCFAGRIERTTTSSSTTGATGDLERCISPTEGDRAMTARSDEDNDDREEASGEERDNKEKHPCTIDEDEDEDEDEDDDEDDDNVGGVVELVDDVADVADVDDTEESGNEGTAKEQGNDENENDELEGGSDEDDDDDADDDNNEDDDDTDGDGVEINDDGNGGSVKKDDTSCEADKGRDDAQSDEDEKGEDDGEKDGECADDSGGFGDARDEDAKTEDDPR
jgi:hypothetical protein